MKIAYITSMKKGLPSFVMREIDELKKYSVGIEIYATKYSRGLYMPAGPVYRMQPARIILMQLFYFFIFFGKYLTSFLLSLKTKTVVDFMIACDFSAHMRANHMTHIHCVEGLRSFNIGYYSKRLLGLPLTVTIYADGLYIAPSPELFKLALVAADQVITICEFNKKILLEQYHVPSEKLKIVPVVLDTEKLSLKKPVNILIVAQFAARKGHQVLFEAVKRLNRDDICIWVVGSKGTDKTYVDVQELARQLGMQDRVIFWGNLPEAALHFLYKACDIFCLPSTNAEVPEGTPVAIMEAMAFEKPVVTTRHAGIPEYVTEMLVAEFDVEALAQALLYLIENPEERLRQGIANRKIIAEKFSVASVRPLVEIFGGSL